MNRVKIWWVNLLPEHRTWWARWWMYPRTMVGPRMIGVGGTWEYELYFWLCDWKARLTPGQCSECRAKDHLHKMRCSRLRGVPGKRNWSQDG